MCNFFSVLSTCPPVWRNSLVDIVGRLRAGQWANFSIPCRRMKGFCSGRPADRRWVLLSFQFDGNYGYFHEGEAVGAWRIPLDFHLVPRLRRSGVYLHPICLQGVHDVNCMCMYVYMYIMFVCVWMLCEFRIDISNRVKIRTI